MVKGKKMILTIDPSIADLGYAVGSLKELNDWGHKRTYSKWKLERRVQTLNNFLEEIVEDWKVDRIVYEMPQAFRYGHKTKGIDTFLKMGMSFGAFLVIDNVEFQAVTPKEWKGTQSKAETKLLVENVYGVTSNNNNVCDACGIYHWYVRSQHEKS